VVCATHDEIDRVTEAIRSARKEAGELGNSGVRLPRDVSLNWTQAQKSEMRNFRPGQRLGFHKAVKGIAKNETVEVVRVEDRRLVIKGHDGQEKTLTLRQANSFDVLGQRSIEITLGDRLMLTANCRTKRFKATNGEIATVSGVDFRGRIRLKDRRTLPEYFRQFTHGYAVTAHQSQGKSVDSVILSGDGMGKELFYVAASRGRRGVKVITSDKNLLRETVGRSAARLSASELARKSRPEQQRGIRRGLDAARKMARRVAQYVFSPFRREPPAKSLECRPQDKPEMQPEARPEMGTEIPKEHDRGISR
jgi:hypothetical protein